MFSLFRSQTKIINYLKDNKIKNETCFCIGETTVAALPKTVKNIIVANQPSIEEVIEDAIEEFR